MRRSACLIAILLLTVVPARAQDSRRDADTGLEIAPPPYIPASRIGQTAETAAGRVGERRTREQVKGVAPMARIDTRIQNRVQARIRSRIDRHYDPRANATSPFVVAGEATMRAAGQRPRR